MIWLKSNWRWSVLNFSAVSVLVAILTQGSTDWRHTDTFDPMLASGQWAMRFLLGCLMMTPLNLYFGWREAVKLRKPAGLWAFAFAVLHLWLYIRQASLEWLAADMPSYLTLGLIGISILSVLAATSNRWAMQRLKKKWKQLHRLVYLAGMAVVAHSMLATMISKKIHVRDPQAPQEIKIYIAILCVLLVVRMPFVRHLLTQVPNLLKHHWRLKPQPSPIAIAGGGVELLSEIHGRESGISIKPTFIIPNAVTEFSVLHRVHEPSATLKKPPDGYIDDQPVEPLLEVEREN